jgi:hypothetical protein
LFAKENNDIDVDVVLVLSMINLNKSFIECYSDKEATNISVKSVLKTEGNTFFLLKECWSEVNTIRPFSEKNERYEYLVIADDNELLSYSDGSLYRNKKNKHNKHLIDSEIKYLSFKEVLDIASSSISNEIYCQIKYNYQKVDYELINKCEMINYNTINNNYKFLQPIMGYVPFVDHNQINFGYVAVHDNEEKNGNLEYILKEKSPIFNTKPQKIFIRTHNNSLKLVKIKSQNLIILLIKFILNKLLFFKKSNSFTKLISIKEFKINYFRYTK